jgi:hypothetical protein
MTDSGVAYDFYAADELIGVLRQLAELIGGLSALRGSLDAADLTSWTGHKRDEFVVQHRAQQDQLAAYHERALTLIGAVSRASESARAQLARDPRYRDSEGPVI